MIPRAYEVEAPDGWYTLFKERSDAERYAPKCHGVIHELYRGDDDRDKRNPEPEPREH